MLFHGDILDLIKNIEDESIDLVVTDPPYKTTSRGNAGNSGGMLQKQINKSGKVFSHNDINIKDYANELYRILKSGSHCYIMTNHTNLIEMLNELTNVGFHFIKCLIWDKGNKIMGQYYMSQFEYVIFLRKGKAKWINNIGNSKTVHQFNNIIGNKNHPTEKPVDLLEFYIKNSSQEKDIVLDPFMGSGSTGVACINTNRKFIGIELDLDYFKIAKQRIENASNYLK